MAIVSPFYALLMMARTNGKTLGRMALGIRVVRANGKPMTFGFAMLREVAVKALLFGILASITAGLASLADVLWPLWTTRTARCTTSSSTRESFATRRRSRRRRALDADYASAALGGAVRRPSASR